MLTRAQQLRDRAQKCRELAATAMTEEGRSILIEIAERYEGEAATAVESPEIQPLVEVAA